MAENTEAQMLQRLDVLIAAAQSLGAAYTPPDADASIAHLQAQAVAGQAAVDGLDDSESSEDAERNSRQALYADIAARGSDVFQYCKAMGWDARDLADLQSKVRELRGGRAVPKPEDNPATPDIDESDTGGSASQRSFASLAGHWSEIVSFLEEKSYTTTEDGITLVDLTDLRDQLRAANNSIAAVEGASAAGRQTRDNVFYTGAGSVVESAKASKNYIRARHDDTQAWQMIKGLEFQIPRRLR